MTIITIVDELINEIIAVSHYENPIRIHAQL